MRRQVQAMEMSKLEDYNISPEAYFESNINRILDQSKFDYPLEIKREGVSLKGGCQTAIIFSAIEGFLLSKGIKDNIPYEIMRKFLIDMDKFWDGKGEKIEKAMKYLAVKGLYLEGIGTIKAIDLGDIPPIEASFEDVKNAVNTFHCVGLGFKMASGFFSHISGTYGLASYSKNNTRPRVQFHAMRAATVESDLKEERIIFTNSWGIGWPSSPRSMAGTGFMQKSKFDGTKLAEIKFCNFSLS